MFHADIPTTPEQCLRKYVKNLVSLLASLNPEILLDDGVTILLWNDCMIMRFDMKFLVRFNLFLWV